MADRVDPVNRCDAPSDGHVVPIDDLREHADSRGCWCQPRLQLEPISGTVIVVHNSLDGRELIEEHGIN